MMNLKQLFQAIRNIFRSNKSADSSTQQTVVYTQPANVSGVPQQTTPLPQQQSQPPQSQVAQSPDNVTPTISPPPTGGLEPYPYPYPAPVGTHWEKNNSGWILVYTDPRIYNPDGTVKPQEERVSYQKDKDGNILVGESFPPSTWRKPLTHDGYNDYIADAWNALLARNLDAVQAWDQAMKIGIGGQVSNAAVQQYPQDRQEIHLSYSYAEDHNRQGK